MPKIGSGVIADRPHRMYAKVNSVVTLPIRPVVNSCVRWMKR